MSKYLEEYLVKLGFDVNSEKGKEYVKTAKDIDKQTETMQKNSEKNVKGTKAETDAINGLQGAFKQFKSVLTSIKSGDILGAFGAGAVGAKGLQSILGILTGQNVNAKGVENAGKAFDGLGRSIHTADVSTANLKRTMLSTFGTPAESGQALQALSGIAAGGSAVTGAGAAAVTIGVGAAVGMVAAIAAAAVGMFEMANGIANANIQVENLARTMWISNQQAWQLSNTLSAMGKTPADLSTIALNPALNEQFQTLQEFQKTFLQLPSDFEAVNESWTKNVQTPISELSATFHVLTEEIGYDFEKYLEKPLELYLDFLITTIKAFSLLASLMSPKSSTNTTTPSISTPAGYSAPTYSLAPNSPSSSSSVTASSNVTVNVYPQSGDPQSIAQASAAAVQQADNQAAILKTVQGANR